MKELINNALETLENANDALLELNKAAKESEYVDQLECITSDDAAWSYDNYDDMHDRYNELNRDTVWYQANGSELQFSCCDSLKDAKLVHTVIDGSGVSILFDGKEFGVRKHVLTLIGERLGLSSKAVMVLSKPELVASFNLLLKYAEDSIFKISIVEGKVNAFVTEKYNHMMSCYDVLETANDVIELKDNDYEFLGFGNYQECYAEWQTKLDQKFQNEIYNKYFVIKSSDSTSKSITIDGMLVKGDRHLPLMSPISIKHIGSNVIHQVEKSFNQLDVIMEDRLIALQDLDEYLIQSNPAEFVLELARTLNAKIKTVKRFLDSRTADHMLNYPLHTALDAYLFICDAYSAEFNEQELLIATNDLADIINLDMETVDDLVQQKALTKNDGYRSRYSQVEGSQLSLFD